MTPTPTPTSTSFAISEHKDDETSIPHLQLDSGNYLLWRKLVRALLIKRNAWLFIGYGDKVLDAAPPHELNILRMRAHLTIVKCLGPDLGPKFMLPMNGCDPDPLYLWNTIRYDAMKAMQPWDTLKAIQEVKLEDFDGDDGMKNYLEKLDELIAKYEFSAEVTVDGFQKTYWYINGLPESWARWVQVYKLRGKDQITRLAEVEELRLAMFAKYDRHIMYKNQGNEENVDKAVSETTLLTTPTGRNTLTD